MIGDVVKSYARCMTLKNTGGSSSVTRIKSPTCGIVIPGSAFVENVNSVLQYIKGGKMRPLAVTSTKRSHVLPDVPTMAEAGVPVDLVAWSGAFVPAGTPRPIIDRLNKLMHTAMSSREYQEQAVKSGTEPTPMSPEQFGEFVRSEVENWARAVKAAGIQPE